MQRAIRDNLELLESCDSMLRSLSTADYLRKADVCFGGAIGEHVRHLLDHYLGLFSAIENGGRVDYEARARDPRIERDPAYAMTILRDVVRRVSDFGDADLDAVLTVRVEGEDPPAWAGSSLGRELGFLVSHTVHHCALINVICRASGVAVPPGFGVAPSTLRHRAGDSGTCAH